MVVEVGDLSYATACPKGSRRSIARTALLGKSRSQSSRSARRRGRSDACRPGGAAVDELARAARRARRPARPSSFTPPCAIRRRASDVDATPNDATSSAGRCTGSPVGKRHAPATSSGASRCADDAREVRLGRLARPPRRASGRRSSARARASTPSARRPAAPARRRAATSRAAARPGSASSGRTSPPAARSAGCCCPTDELIFSPSHESRSGVVSTTCGSSP